jgi:hypothetical protein
VSYRARQDEWFIGTDANLDDVSYATLAKDFGYGGSGLYEFTYGTGDQNPFSDACTPNSPPNMGTVYANKEGMEASASTFLTSFGLNYSLVNPNFNTGWPNPTYSGCGATESMSEQILIDGVSTDQSVNFSFNSTGRIVSAQTPVFSIGTQASFPLDSQSVAASSLVQSNPAASPSGAELVTVKLKSAQVSLNAFQLADGSTWFLPVYQFEGDGYSQNVSPDPLAWAGAVLAVGPPDVTVAAASVSHLRHRGVRSTQVRR